MDRSNGSPATGPPGLTAFGPEPVAPDLPLGGNPFPPIADNGFLSD